MLRIYINIFISSILILIFLYHFKLGERNNQLPRYIYLLNLKY